MSAQPEVPIPKTKKQAARLVRELIRLDRQMQVNTAEEERRVAKNIAALNAPLQASRDRYAAALAAFGEQRLPADGSDGFVDLGYGRKVYRERSEAVIISSANKVVAELKSRPFWRRIFLSRKVTYSVSKDAVKRRPYIARKVAGLSIVKRNGLYLQTGAKGAKPEALSVIETD